MASSHHNDKCEYFKENATDRIRTLRSLFIIWNSVPLYFVGLIFTFVAIFPLNLFVIFGVGLPSYLSNHNPFSREHFFVCFNEFPSIVCRCIVIHHHRPQGPTLFQRERWDFTCVQCDVCTDTGPLVLSPSTPSEKTR